MNISGPIAFQPGGMSDDQVHHGPWFSAGTSIKQNSCCCTSLPVTLTNSDSKGCEGKIWPRPIGHENQLSCCKCRGSNDNSAMRGRLSILSKIKGHFNTELRGLSTAEQTVSSVIYAQRCRQLCSPQFCEKEKKPFVVQIVNTHSNKL
jgi:hypothetical protein